MAGLDISGGRFDPRPLIRRHPADFPRLRPRGSPIPDHQFLTGTDDVLFIQSVQAAQRYIRAYEMLTGSVFEPAELPAAPRIARTLQAWIARS